VRREAAPLRHESIEHEKKDVVKIEAEKIAKKRRIVKRSYADSPALPVGFARLKYLLVNFKLPDSYKKFDGLQNPEDWLIDYLETVKLMGVTRVTVMQSIQIHLSGAAR
jgi:hypothetical protein